MFEYNDNTYKIIKSHIYSNKKIILLIIYSYHNDLNYFLRVNDVNQFILNESLNSKLFKIKMEEYCFLSQYAFLMKLQFYFKTL